MMRTRAAAGFLGAGAICAFIGKLIGPYYPVLTLGMMAVATVGMVLMLAIAALTGD